MYVAGAGGDVGGPGEKFGNDPSVRARVDAMRSDVCVPEGEGDEEETRWAEDDIEIQVE
jgi:hypothetical protein